jgi:serine/threonine protein kinase
MQGSAEFKNEIKLLSRLEGHRNIVSVLGFASDGKRDHCIITPFFPRGSLQAALNGDRKSQLNFSCFDRVGACLDVATGILTLHAHNIWHLDLKRKSLSFDFTQSDVHTVGFCFINS